MADDRDWDGNVQFTSSHFILEFTKKMLSNVGKPGEHDISMNSLQHLKSGLPALWKEGNLSEQFCQQILTKILLPMLKAHVSSKISSEDKMTILQKKKNINEITSILTEYYPRTIGKEVIEMCKKSIYNHLEKSRAIYSSVETHQMEEDSLDVKTSLDLLAHLLESKPLYLIDEEKDAIFKAILELLLCNDEVLCAKITGLILPRYLVNEERSQNMKAVWETIKLMQKDENARNSKHNPLLTNSSYAILCGLADFLFESDLNLSTEEYFWKMIQQGLVKDDTLSKKRSMYLLKKALEECRHKKDKYISTADASDICPLFWWSKDQSGHLMSVWKDYVLLMETLEEKQFHVIEPVLARLTRLQEASQMRSEGPPFLHISWLTSICYKASKHDNKCINRWGVLSLLYIPLAPSSSLISVSNWPFLFGPLLEMINQNSLYIRDDNALKGELPPVAIAIVYFFKSCSKALPGNQKARFFTELLTAIETSRLNHLTLLYLTQALASVPPFPAWKSCSVPVVKNVLNSLLTHDSRIRGATQCFILQAFLHLADTNDVTMCDVISIMGWFPQSDSLCRPGVLWQSVCAWIGDNLDKLIFEDGFTSPQNLEGIERIVNYLTVKVSVYLKDSVSTFTSFQLCRIIVLLFDSVFSVFQTEIEKSDVSQFQMLLQNILQPVIHVISKAKKHVYMSKAIVDKALEIVLSILKELIPVGVAAEQNAFERNSDFTKIFIQNEIIPCIPELFEYIVSELITDWQGSDTLSKLHLYLDLFNSLWIVVSVDISGNMLVIWKKFIEQLCIKAIAIMKAMQCSNFDLSISQWFAFIASSCCLSWIGSIIDAHTIKPAMEATSERLVSFITDMKLLQQFKRPGNDGKDIENGLSQKEWGKWVSTFLASQWSLVDFCLRRPGFSLCNKDQTPEINECTLKNGLKAVIAACLDGLSVASGDSVVSVLKCIKSLLSQSFHDHNVVMEIIDSVWVLFQEEHYLDQPWFWTVAVNVISIIFDIKILNFNETSEIHNKVCLIWKQIKDMGQDQMGTVNVVSNHIYRLWKDEMCIQSFQFHKNLLCDLAMFGPIHKTDKRIFIDAVACISALGSTCPLNFPDSMREDQYVRAHMISIFASLTGNNVAHQQFAKDVIELLVQRNAEVGKEKKASTFVNSAIHRSKQRIWQAVSVLHPLVPDDFVETLVKLVFLAAQEGNLQTSVRYVLEWLLVRLLYRRPNLLFLLWDELDYKPDKRIGSVITPLTVLSKYGTLLSNPSEQTNFYMQAFPAIMPWLLITHAQARIYTQAALQTMWEFCKSNKLASVLDKYSILNTCAKFLDDNKDYARQKLKLLENVFFYSVHPIKHFTVESLFIDLPRLTSVVDNEWITLDMFNRVHQSLWQGNKTSIPLQNQEQLVHHQILPILSGKQVKVQQDPHCNASSVDDSATGITDIQKKITPWKLTLPDEDLETVRQRNLMSYKQSVGELVLVASLIDKVPNLGGLCRTAEIFGVSKLVLGNLKILDEQQFKSVSVSSERWLEIEEVQPTALDSYLFSMQQKGFTIIGVEQTAKSRSLTNYKFPTKSVLLLGNEKQGIPVELIQLLEDCVEIPQMGVTRSLNVHVSGALLVWEYTRQQLLHHEENQSDNI